MAMAIGEVMTPAVVGQVKPNTAAAAAGIKPGDSIKAIDNQPVSSFEDLQRIVTLNNGETLAIALQRKGALLTVHVTPRLTQEQDRFGNTYKVPILGISARVNAAQVVYPGPLAAFGRAAGEIRYIVDTVLNFRVQLVRGRADTSQLSGPLGIMKMSGQVASVSFLALLNLAALISVSIGLLNLFPIPILDGGHLLYYGIEAVLGRPLSARAQDVGFRLGLALVLGLFFLATWNDLVRLKLF
jgi:regulator of sigma E protease